MLTVTLGAWLKAHQERPARGPRTDAAGLDTAAAADPPTPIVTPSPSDADVAPSYGPSFGRRALTLAGIPFSYRVPADGWERRGSISLNKSSRGPQGAEAIIFWTTFPFSDFVDPCFHLLSPPVGPSPTDLAVAVSTAPGIELVGGPSDVVVGGRDAKRVMLIVRSNVGCRPGFFFTWNATHGGALWTKTSVGDTIRMWIVDVGGTRMVIEAETTEDAGPALEREIRQIVRSIRFGNRRAQDDGDARRETQLGASGS